MTRCHQITIFKQYHTVLEVWQYRKFTIRYISWYLGKICFESMHITIFYPIIRCSNVDYVFTRIWQTEKCTWFRIKNGPWLLVSGKSQLHMLSVYVLLGYAYIWIRTQEITKLAAGGGGQYNTNNITLVGNVSKSTTTQTDEHVDILMEAAMFVQNTQMNT